MMAIIVMMVIINRDVLKEMIFNRRHLHHPDEMIITLVLMAFCLATSKLYASWQDLRNVSDILALTLGSRRIRTH